MNTGRGWRARLQASVRAQLLALALGPLLLALVGLLLVLAAWTTLAYDRLLQTKVRADLAVAHGYFEQMLQQVGSGTREVAESHALHRQLQRLGPHGPGANAQPAPLQTWLEQERLRLGLDMLVLRPPHDTAAPPAQARGSAARLVVWEPAQVDALAAHLQPRLGIALVPTRNAAPTARTAEERALLMLASAPLPDDAPWPGWVLHGGVLLNRNLDFIDHINRLVYPEDALPFGSQGTATLFLDDVRISTNVRLFGEERAIGTRVSHAVREAVLGEGRTWFDRAFVVNDWYVSAYEPLSDSQGQRIGMLYVGFLEAPLRWVKWAVLAGTALLFGLVMAGAAHWSLRRARALVEPVERMDATMRRVGRGDTAARVGPVGSRDELGALAQHLDRLLDLLAEQTAHLRAWAETLDQRVAERTRELQASHAALRQAQQQLIRSERLATIGQLSAGLAHEINNPIAVIQGNLDLLRETLGPAAAPVQAELALIDAQVERIRLIVTRLLQHARPTEFAGYVELLALPAVLDDCVVLVERLLQQHGIRLQRDDRATTPVACNRQELQQVVINLLVNAVQASRDGAEVELASGDWLECGTPVGAWVEVRDRGPGLSPQVRARLFTPFFTTKPEGHGLGLWVSQGLLERYGGRLEADNRSDGPGAVFRVRLYAEPREPQPGQA